MKQKSLILLTLLLSTGLFAQDIFVRSAVIDVPAIEAGGFGNVVAGVDFDGDGMLEIFAVNNNWNDGPEEVIPRLYKYEFNGTSWDSVWSTVLNVEFQNTWPALNKADLDKDGKMEIVWGVPNNFGTTNPTPSRFVIYEQPDGGGDALGVDNGDGTWTPNARWDFDLPADTEMRGITAIVGDFDNDDVTEVAFADRRGYFSLAMFSVSDVPDAGDGSETWTQEFNGNVSQSGFVRNGVIQSPDGGFGGVVAGMDYDADGLMELYSVNDNWNDGPNGELIPMLYKYELVSGAWVLRWSTRIPGMDFQNTWPILVAGDWDADGKGEVIWCPVNNFGAGNEDPDRIVVYETPGDGSDVMGIDNGDGTASPNAGWNMDVDSSVSMRPFRGTVADIDGDGAAEFVFTERHNLYVWGVVGVSDIPDAGDGSETWTMEANGVPDAGNDYRDVAVIDETIYLFDSDGGIREITNDGAGTYTVADRYQAYPGWSWLSANTVDIDDDGTEEIVTGDYLSGGTASVFVLVEDGDSLLGYPIADFSANTANRITSVRAGLIDADSLVDFAVGFRGTDAVYLVSYQGGDITMAGSYNVALLDSGVLGTPDVGQMDMMEVADINGDGTDEVFYTGVPRSLNDNMQPMTIGSYNADLTIGSSLYDLVQIDSTTIVGVNLDGDIFPINYNGMSWDIGHAQVGLNSENGDFLSSVSADVDGDGVNELFYGEYWGTGQVYMLKQMNGAYHSYAIADLGALGAVRLTGGAAGDIDQDGFVDLVFGTRESTPVNSVYRVEFTGGDATDMMSWSTEIIDSDILAGGGQIDQVKIANMDDDEQMEVVYTGIPRGGGLLPIVVLDVQTVDAETIAEVKVDANGDFVPDRMGEIVTIKGVITSPTINSLFSLSITVQDETAGISIYSSEDSILTTVGDLVQITGEVGQYNGLTQLVVSDRADIRRLGAGTVPAPIVLSPSFYTDPMYVESLESMLIQINGLTKVDGEWPDSNDNSNLDVWDGAKSPEGDSLTFKIRIDKDLDLAGMPEPVYPMNVVGFLAQYDPSTPPDDGYQLFPRYYSDIEQNVAAPPNANFWFTGDTRTNYDGQTVVVGDVADEFTFAWHPAVDLNDDALIYQMIAIIDGTSNNVPAADTFVTLTGQDIIDNVFNAESKTVLITIMTKGAESAIVTSVDTISVTFDITVGVDSESLIPKEFFVDQNYPNPFNPSTTIQFGLPAEVQVNLIVYDILGRKVATLINNENMSAGTYQHNFDASHLASGTYIYRLQAGQKVQVKKMLLLK